MVWADWVVRAFALFGVVVFSWQVGKYGVRYVMTEIAGWFSVAKTDFLALKADFLELEARVKAIEKYPFLQTTHSQAAEPPKVA